MNAAIRVVLALGVFAGGVLLAIAGSGAVVTMSTVRVPHPLAATLLMLVLATLGGVCTAFFAAVLFHTTLSERQAARRALRGSSTPAKLRAAPAPADH